MTIDEAIKRLEQHTFKATSEPGREYNNALNLGIEALNTVLKWRKEHRDLGFLLLPGETEE